MFLLWVWRREAVGEKAWRVEELGTNWAMEGPHVAHIGSQGASEGRSFIPSPAAMPNAPVRSWSVWGSHGVLGYILGGIQVLHWPRVPGVPFWLCSPRGFCHLSTRAGK